MRILYGVVGEGMGHAIRSRVVLDELVQRHDVQVVVSGRAHDGSIEAIEDPAQPFCMAVLWHPEEAHAAAGAPLFRALVEAAAARRSQYPASKSNSLSSASSPDR